MKNLNAIIVFNNIRLPFDASVEEAFSVAKQKCLRIGLKNNVSDPYVYKRSIDARNKNSILFVYSIAMRINENISNEALLSKFGANIIREERPKIEIGEKKLSSPTVIVGSGPAGMYAGLILAENGYNPIILERGDCVKNRINIVNQFNKTHILNKNTNIQFGA